jgi:putative redox protein
MVETNIKSTIGRDHYRVVLTAGKNTIIADEPTSAGGGDEGMNPHEILASALGACTCATLRMYADRKEWPLEGVNITVILTHDGKGDTNIHREIELLGDLTQEQRSRLYEISNKCPVHKTLTNPITIDTKLVTQNQ